MLLYMCYVFIAVLNRHLKRKCTQSIYGKFIKLVIGRRTVNFVFLEDSSNTGGQ